MHPSDLLSCRREVRAGAEGAAFASREVLAGKNVRSLAGELLAKSRGEFSSTFKGSRMKRAKLHGLKRNAVVVLGNVGTADDVDMLTRALDDPDLLV